MRSRILVGFLLISAFVSTASLGARNNSAVGKDKQWSIVNFADPVLVNGRFVMGQVLIVHDDAKMARGEACTTFYRFDAGKGPKEELVSFHCIPRQTNEVASTTLTTYSPDPTCRKLVEYQIAGDTEAHGIPR